MEQILNKAELTSNLTKDEIITLLKSDGAKLFSTANNVRQNIIGNQVHLRALIEFSNICKCNCKYCGIRCDNKNVERYRLSENEIISTVLSAIEEGYKTIVLQSGEDAFYNANRLGEIIQTIKKHDVALTLSIGELSYDDYKYLKDCGADRFLLRIETTDEKLYSELHPNMSLKNRKRCLNDLRTLNYEVGTGVLVGLPNQTIESLADDILYFKSINADMIGIGPFIPHPQTPLNSAQIGDLNLALKVMSVTRLVLPNINIPATTAMETLLKNGRTKALQSGANVVMINVTDKEYRSKYSIYPDKKSASYAKIEKELLNIGRSVSNIKGFRGE